MAACRNEPHPDDADDLVWWVLWQGQVFSDDPRESVEEAADILAQRVRLDPGMEPTEGHGAGWGLVRASRGWGYRKFTGT